MNQTGTTRDPVFNGRHSAVEKEQSKALAPAGSKCRGYRIDRAAANANQKAAD